MKKLLAGLLLLWLGAAQAQVIDDNSVFSPATASYAGPGDVVGSAKGWWGLRAYSAATRGANAVNVCNVGDAACADWATDATTGALVPVSVGGTDCTAVSTCTIKIIYDQSGSLFCGGAACDVTEPTAAQRMTYIHSCINSKPCMRGAGVASMQYQSTAHASAIPQPFTMSAVVSRTGLTTSTNIILADDSSNAILNFRAATNTLQMFAGTAGQTVANISDNNFHAFQAMFNGASSFLMCGGSAGTNCSVAGTDNAISPGTAGAAVNGLFSVAGVNNSSPLSGDITEVGEWAVGFTGTERTNMTANQYNYWGPF